MGTIKGKTLTRVLSDISRFHSASEFTDKPYCWCTRFSRIYFIALQIASHLYNYCRFPPSGSGHLFSSTNEEVIQSPVGSNRFDFEVVPIEHSWQTADCMFGREFLVVYGCFWLILIVEGR